MALRNGRRAWLALIGCFAMGAGFNAYIIAPASISPVIAAEFDIGKPAVGLAISVIYLGWGVAGLPGGFLTDRYDNRYLVFGGVGVFVAAAWLGTLFPSYTAFLGFRLVAGATGALLWTTNTNVVTRVFPDGKRSLATGLFVASAPVGQALAQFGSPMVANALGWNAAFALYPVIVLLGVPPMALALREPVRSDSRMSPGDLLSVLRNPKIVAVSLAGLCTYSLFLFFSSWMPTYATEVLSLPLAAAGAATALVPFAGVVARPGGGWLSERVGRRTVIALGLVLTLPVIFAVPLAESTLLFVALLAAAGATVQLGVGVLYVYASEVAEPGTVGTALAILTTVSTVGSLTAPTVSGWLISNVSWTAGFGYAAVVAVVGLGCVTVMAEG